MVDREVECALGHRVPAELAAELVNRAAERQVAQVVFERSEACDDLAVHSEGGDAIGESFLGLRDDLKNHATQRLEAPTLRLRYTPQVLVDLGRHSEVV